MTSMHQHRARPESIKQLAAMGVVAPDTTSLYLGSKALPVYRRWIDQQHTFEKLEDFDRVFKVRSLLVIPGSEPVPTHVVQAAIEFMDRYNLSGVREFRRLIPCSSNKNDPTLRIFFDLAAIQSREKASPVSLDEFRASLPSAWQNLTETALDPVFGDDLEAPSPRSLARLMKFGPLRVPASIYLLRVCAGVFAGEAHVVNALARIDEKLAATAFCHSTSEKAMAATLEDLIKEASHETENGRGAIQSLVKWLTMAKELQTIIAASEIESAASDLAFVCTTRLSYFAKIIERLRRGVERHHADQRQARAGPLSVILPEVSAIALHRCQQVTTLRNSYNAACYRLKSERNGYVDFVQEYYPQSDDGIISATPILVQWRVWTYEAFTADFLPPQSTGLKYHRDRLLNASQRAFGSEPYLEYRGVVDDTELRDFPFFLPIFSLDLCKGSRKLRLDIRNRRLETLKAAGLSTGWAPVVGIFNFPENTRSLYLYALNANRILIPITSFALGMQIASLVVRLGFETLARAGEILQIRYDLDNIDYNHDNDCAFWLAWPKGAQRDPLRTDVTRERYCLASQTLAEMEALIADMESAWGREAALTNLLQVVPNLRSLGAAPWLFRGSRTVCSPFDLSMLMSYLLIGVAQFGVHDLRAAGAKFLLKNGHDPAAIQELLKHKVRETSERYWEPYDFRDADAPHGDAGAGPLVRRLDLNDRISEALAR